MSYLLIMESVIRRKSSTCEMVYDFIVDSGHQDKINEEIGECIYAGVVGDTGSFRFPSAHAGVHTMVADLKIKRTEAFQSA